MPVTSTPWLNHAYRVVDAATYAAIRDTPWVGDAFAPREERTTNRPDWSYSGLYLYGRRTYLEFFDEAAQQGPVGGSGMALGVHEGSTPAVIEAWRVTLGAARTALVARPTEAGGVPWFHLGCAEPDRRDHLHLWSMEYHAEFLARWHAGLTPATSPTPAAVLDRYAARVTDHPREAFLLQDVTRLELSLSAAALDFLEAHLSPLAATTDGATTRRLTAVLDGTDVVAWPEENPRGLVALTCQLQRDVAPRQLQLGTSTLHLDRRTARWQFA